MIEKEKKVKDFGEGIRKAISNLSRAHDKCMDQWSTEMKRIEEISMIMNKSYKTANEYIENTKMTDNPEYQYECPKCSAMHTYEGELTTVRCYSCDNIFQTDRSDDWKILDVNCLPSDFMVAEYDIKHNGEFCNKFKNTFDDKIGLLSNLNDGEQYTYRLKQTKKSHEELAEEYVKGKLLLPNDRAFLTQGFIAGRKSMEGE